jgi:hypothetical protein
MAFASADEVEFRRRCRWREASTLDPIDLAPAALHEVVIVK